jgi:cell shape-determining protein MreD
MWGSGHGERADPRVGFRIIWATALILALPVQASLAPIVSIGNTAPDVPLLVMLFFALYHGPAASAAAGAALGAALDLFGAGGGPFYLAAYAALAVTASAIGRVTATVRAWTIVAVIALGSLTIGVGQMVWGAPVERADELMSWFTIRLAPQALYDTTLALMLYGAWMWRYPPPRDGLGERDEFFSARRLQGLIR